MMIFTECMQLIFNLPEHTLQLRHQMLGMHKNQGHAVDLHDILNLEADNEK